MVQPIALNAHREIAAFAEAVADICRRRIYERPHDPIPLEHIMAQTGEPRPRVQAAVAWLERQERLHLGHYAMRTRPHVAVEAVDRIDDLAIELGHGQARQH